MTTSDAAVDKTAEKSGTEKVSEKLAEKRRALGRGLESLLPGPRVVTASPTLPQSTRQDGAPAPAGSQFPVLSSQKPDSSLSSSAVSADFSGGRAGTPVAPSAALAGWAGTGVSAAGATGGDGVSHASAKYAEGWGGGTC